jgi:hypothetical protein
MEGYETIDSRLVVRSVAVIPRPSLSACARDASCGARPVARFKPSGVCTLCATACAARSANRRAFWCRLRSLRVATAACARRFAADRNDGGETVKPSRWSAADLDRNGASAR